MKIESAIQKLSYYSIKYRSITLLSFLVATLCSAIYVNHFFELKTSNLDLVDETLPEIKAFIHNAQQFGSPNIIIMMISHEDKMKMHTVVRDCQETIQAIPGVRAVIQGIPYVNLKTQSLEMQPLATHNGQEFLLLIQPEDIYSSVLAIEPLVNQLKQFIHAYSLAHQGVRMNLTGMPVYAIDDKEIIQTDIAKLSWISFIAVAIIFLLGFKNPLYTLIAVFSLMISVLLTLGVISIFPGHLTLLTSSFAAIMIGLGIDTAIHIIHHFEEDSSKGSHSNKIISTFHFLGRGLFTGYCTTALIFLSMYFCQFKGFRELGVIAFFGLTISFFCTLTLFPCLLSFLKPSNVSESHKTSRFLKFSHSKRWMLVSIVMLLISLGAGMPEFDANYLNLQPENSQTVNADVRIQNESNFSTLFAIFSSDKIEVLQAIEKKLTHHPLVKSLISPVAFMQSNMPSDVSHLNAYEDFFKSDHNHFSLIAFPKYNLWNEKFQKEFNSSMKAIDEKVTGMSYVGQLMISQTQEALYTLSIGGLIILLVCVYADFKSVPLTLCTLSPTILTFLSLPGIMNMLHVSYNPINVMALPVILGISIDDGVHLTHRFLNERGNLKHVFAGTGRSILLTSLTTLAAFTSIAFTTHRGLSSLCLLMIIGVTLAYVYSMFFLPELLVYFKLKISER